MPHDQAGPRSEPTAPPEPDPEPPSTSGPRMRARALLPDLVIALRSQRRVVLLALGAALADATALLVLPLMTGLALDRVVTGEPVAAVASAIAVVGVLRAAASAGRRYWSVVLMAELGAALRERVYAHLQGLSPSYHARTGTGQLLARASSDVTVIENVSGLVPFLVQSVLLGLGGAVLMVLLDPTVALAALVLLALGGGTTLLLVRPVAAAAGRVQDAQGDWAELAEQQVSGIHVVKGLGLESSGRQRGRAAIAELSRAGRDLGDLRARFLGAFLTVPSAAVLLVVLAGGLLGADGRISAGDLLACLQYLGLLVVPVLMSAHLVVVLPSAVAASRRVAGVLAVAPEVVDRERPTALPPGPGCLELRGVRFRYHPDVPVLHDVDLVVPGGRSVALVGASGSGKSTLLELVPRLADPDAGEIRLDGVPVQHLRLSDLRTAVATALEEPVVFTTTVWDNVVVGRPGATPEQVLEAARRACFDEVVAELPDGWATVVGEQGSSLSGGQRQRLALARALIRESRVLLLDNATSALDPATEARVLAGVREASRGRTLVTVAHRAELLDGIDVVVLLDRGRVLATGSHEELLRLPAYRRALALPPLDRTAAESA